MGESERMTTTLPHTGERIRPDAAESVEDYLLYTRHVFAYEVARPFISGTSVVLDLGCGEGYGTHRLSHSVRRVVGLDVDPTTVAHAAQHYGSTRCAFRVYDGVTIPAEANAFDGVVSFQVIEHLHDDRQYLSEVYRVLKPGGVFLLTTPNRLHRLKPGQQPRNRFHVREYHPDEFAALLHGQFPESAVWGIRGTDEVQRIELDRVNPQTLVRMFNKVVRRQSLKHGDGLRYGLQDFFVIQEQVSESLDLLGVCRKDGV